MCSTSYVVVCERLTFCGCVVVCAEVYVHMCLSGVARELATIPRHLINYPNTIPRWPEDNWIRFVQPQNLVLPPQNLELPFQLSLKDSSPRTEHPWGRVSPKKVCPQRNGWICSHYPSDGCGTWSSAWESLASATPLCAMQTDGKKGRRHSACCNVDWCIVSWHRGRTGREWINEECLETEWLSKSMVNFQHLSAIHYGKVKLHREKERE